MKAILIFAHLLGNSCYEQEISTLFLPYWFSIFVNYFIFNPLLRRLQQKHEIAVATVTSSQQSCGNLNSLVGPVVTVYVSGAVNSGLVPSRVKPMTYIK